MIAFDLVEKDTKQKVQQSIRVKFRNECEQLLLTLPEPHGSNEDIPLPPVQKPWGSLSRPEPGEGFAALAVHDCPPNHYPQLPGTSSDSVHIAALWA